MKHSLVLCLLLLGGLKVSAQQYTTTLGLQFKPIISSPFFRNDGFIKESPQMRIELDAQGGSSFGMVIRRGLSKMFSLEGGINMVSRRYNIKAFALDTNLQFEQNFKWMSYEIPLQTLVFIRLGENLFLNAASGFSLNFFPTDIQGQNLDFYQITYRYNWIRTALTANLGFEWRTNQSGYFYLGASYMQPFNKMAVSRVIYTSQTPKTELFDGFRGNYLTLDLRYFFHQDPNPVTKSKLRRFKKQQEKALQKPK